MFDLKDTVLQSRTVPFEHKKNDASSYLTGSPENLVSASLAKIFFDKVIAGTALIALMPLMLGIATAIRLTTGDSVFFRHKRVGFKGQTFDCLKFRTMVPDAERILEYILETDPVARAEWHAQYKFEHDCRVTPLGRFLRKTSLDELPQLLNVLRGDMALVGPRPVTDVELEVYGVHAAAYKSVRPGVTGLWQVCGRSDIDYDERIALDMHYIQCASLLLDFKVLLKTVGVVLARRGAV